MPRKPTQNGCPRHTHATKPLSSLATFTAYSKVPRLHQVESWHKHNTIQKIVPARSGDGEHIPDLETSSQWLCACPSPVSILGTLSHWALCFSLSVERVAFSSFHSQQLRAYHSVYFRTNLIWGMWGFRWWRPEVKRNNQQPALKVILSKPRNKGIPKLKTGIKEHFYVILCVMVI